MCRQKQTMQSKAGKGYYSLMLQDKTGSIDGKVWDLNSSAIENFEALDFVWVDADIISYNGILQLKIYRLRKASPSEYDPQEYLPHTSRDIEGMYQELKKFIEEKTTDIWLRKLLTRIFIEDQDFAERFKKHSAAKSMHHGYVGGLLEHTLNVTRMCYFYSALYPEVNRSLLLAAAMCHDIGKIRELSPFPANDYTDEGQLLGHIVIGCEMIGEHIRAIEGFPQKTAVELRHCILAHHGQLEYGSPKKPALMEALLLHAADDTDARVEIFLEATSNMNDYSFSCYNKNFDTVIRRTHPAQEG